MVQGAWAQSPEPSEELTKLSQFLESTTYSFYYPSVNAKGEPVVLSAALIAWTPTDRQETDCIESIHLYSHATICADKECPSADSGTQEMTVMKTLPKREYKDAMKPTDVANYVGRCIIIAPDYEGYGVSKDDQHPYLAQRLTARQVLDAYNYGVQLYSKQAEETSVDDPLLPITDDWRTFTLGYSQGGAVSLAVQRLIEEEELSDQMHYYGSIVGDGPYDLIETLRYYFFDDGDSYGKQTVHRKGICTYPMVLPLILKGMCDTNPEVAQYSISDYLSQQLIDTGIIDWIESKQYSTADIASMWAQQLQTGVDVPGRHYTPEQMAEMFFIADNGNLYGHLEKMLTPETFAYLNDPDKTAQVPAVATNAQEAIHRALADNTVANGWEPQHRIQFYHSRGDMIVPYGNYLSFYAAHPSGEEGLYQVNDTFADSDHFSAAIQFFLRLSMTSSFAGHFNWICEGVSPSGIENVGATSEIHPQHDGIWYSLDGSPLSGKPTRRGIYLYNNQKVVIGINGTR